MKAPHKAVLVLSVVTVRYGAAPRVGRVDPWPPVFSHWTPPTPALSHNWKKRVCTKERSNLFCFHLLCVLLSCVTQIPVPSRLRHSPSFGGERRCVRHPRCVLLLPIMSSTRTFAEGTGTHLNSKAILRRKREGGRRLQKSF